MCEAGVGLLADLIAGAVFGVEATRGTMDALVLATGPTWIAVTWRVAVSLADPFALECCGVASLWLGANDVCACFSDATISLAFVK
jgi:hypothetical protein